MNYQATVGFRWYTVNVSTTPQVNSHHNPPNTKFVFLWSGNFLKIKYVSVFRESLSGKVTKE